MIVIQKMIGIRKMTDIRRMIDTIKNMRAIKTINTKMRIAIVEKEIVILVMLKMITKILSWKAMRSENSIPIVKEVIMTPAKQKIMEVMQNLKQLIIKVTLDLLRCLTVNLISYDEYIH